MDEMVIEALELKGRVGTNQWEQSIDQKILIDLLIFHDFSSINDNINETINYDSLCQCVHSYMDQKPFQLIETIANGLAEELLNKFPIQQIKVTVSKPHALKHAKNVKIMVDRSRRKNVFK